MMHEILIAQLMAARAQIDATLAVLQAAGEPAEQGAGCTHPADSVRDVSTMGSAPKWTCFACGEDRNEPFT